MSGAARPMIVGGLMSGTSADGMDAALVEVRESPGQGPSGRLLGFVSRPYPDPLRRRILATVAGGGPAQLARLHLDVARAGVAAVAELLAQTGVAAHEVAALGSHGHTVWHAPPEPGGRGISLQLGDPATLAAGTGIDVVSDFRSADLAAGGHGAPLVPFGDLHLLAHPDEARILLNVGGMANLTWVPPRGSRDLPVAFDTGPGNALLDLAAEAATGGRMRCDLDGRLAAGGRVDRALLDTLAGDPWLDRAPPRSTGRERFGPGLVAELIERRGRTAAGGGTEGEAAWPDLLATLTAFTALTVADAVARWVLPRRVDRVVVTGGGAHNPALLGAVRRALVEAGVQAPVETGAEVLGLDPDAREAAAFALLAWAHLRGVPGNVPVCTGAAGPRVLGSRTPAGPPADGRPTGGAPPGRGRPSPEAPAPA